MSLRRRLAGVAGLLVVFALLVRAMPELSLTYDEPSHLAAGYAWLARGRAGLWTLPLRGHPLLADAWAALPLYAARPHLALEQLPGWGTDRRAYATAFIAAIGPLAASEVAGRVPAALLTVILGAVVYRWAADDLGSLGGAAALGLAALDPTLLAHGRLATNDGAVTALGAAGLFLIWRWTRRPTWRRALGAGLVLGLTCMAKASGVVWCAVGLAYAAGWSLGRAPDRRTVGRRLLQVAGSGALALTVIWACYGFSVGPLSAAVPLPVPAPQHWQALFFQTDAAGERLAYALGRLRAGGWWWYFPLAFALKNPLPWLLVVGAGGLYALRRPRRRRALALPALFAAAYTAVAIVQGPNIGYRHMLPIHPGLYLTGATAVRAARAAARRAPPARAAGAAIAALLLGGWYVGGTLAAWPHEIAYFNELAGGPPARHRYLVSSNLDWGQATKYVQAYLAAHPDVTTYLAYAPPAPYPLEADVRLPPSPGAPEMTSPFYPAPGLYLLGATTLHIPTSCCELGLDSYAYFREATPVDTLGGGAILVYHVTAANRPQWLVQCSAGDPPLSAATLAQGLADAPALRQVTLDCTRAWLYPAGGSTPGLYAFADEGLAFADEGSAFADEGNALADEGSAFADEGNALADEGSAFADEGSAFADEGLAFADEGSAFADEGLAFLHAHLAAARRSYRQPAGFVPPPFVLYTAAGPPQPPVTERAYAARAATAPHALQGPGTLPVTFDGRLKLLGAAVTAAGDGAPGEAATWWRVIAAAEAPFSLMAHLVTAGGEVVAIGDGLDLPPGELRPGDVFVQRHTFGAAAGMDGDGLWLRLGVYDVPDLGRWGAGNSGGADAVFIPARTAP